MLLQYRDQEHDWISFETNTELVTAIQAIVMQGNKVLHLQVAPQPEAPQPEAAQSREVFEGIDSNKDGVVDAQEFDAAVRTGLIELPVAPAAESMMGAQSQQSGVLGLSPQTHGQPAFNRRVSVRECILDTSLNGWFVGLESAGPSESAGASRFGLSSMLSFLSPAAAAEAEGAEVASSGR